MIKKKKQRKRLKLSMLIRTSNLLQLKEASSKLQQKKNQEEDEAERGKINLEENVR